MNEDRGCPQSQEAGHGVVFDLIKRPPPSVTVRRNQFTSFKTKSLRNTNTDDAKIVDNNHILAKKICTTPGCLRTTAKELSTNRVKSP